MAALPWSAMSHKQFLHSERSYFLIVHKVLLLTGLRKENSTFVMANSITLSATNSTLSISTTTVMLVTSAERMDDSLPELTYTE